MIESNRSAKRNYYMKLQSMPVLLSPKRTLHVLTIRMVQTRRSSALNGVDAHNKKLDRPEPPSKKVKVSSLNSVTRHTPELWFIPVTHCLRIQVYYQSWAYVRRVLQITTCINVKRPKLWDRIDSSWKVGAHVINGWREWQMLLLR